jgi:hypothetical protein
MALFRLYADKDTSVANFDGLLDTTSSNVGASEILHLYSGSTEQPTQQANVLVQFSTSSLPSTGSATASFFLHLADAQHAQTLPTDFMVEVVPLEQDWNEGAGQDLDLYTDLGAANWFSASLSASWVAAGGQPSGTVSSSFHFYTGHEDLDVDVTALVTASFGYTVRLQPTVSATYYIKKFHSRHTHFPSKRPYLETRWADWTGTLTSSSFFLVTSGAFSGSYVDPRLNVSGVLSGSGTTVTVTNTPVDPTGTLVLNLYDLHPVYNADDVVHLHLQAQPRNWGLATVATASAVPSTTALLDAYYRVVNDASGEVLVPFGTGALPYTKLSFDDGGNYFDFYMQTIPPSSSCRFDFLVNISGTSTVYRGDGFKFRTE